MSDSTEQRPKIHTDASAQRIARVYAESLLDEAQKGNAAEAILADLTALHNDVAGSDPLLASFFLRGLVGREQRDQVLKRAFAGRADPLLVNFLHVLNDHDRLELIPPILDAYRELLDQRTGKVRVHVRSAFPLDDGQRDHLLRQLRDNMEREPALEAVTDPGLLGGIVVQVGDYLYDASLRAQLESLRNEIIDRSSHEIQIGRDRFSSPA